MPKIKVVANPSTFPYGRQKVDKRGGRTLTGANPLTGRAVSPYGRKKV